SATRDTAFWHAIPLSVFVVPLVCAVHVPPVPFRIVQALPTAQQLEGQVTAFSACVVPLVWAAHVLPPSPEDRIVPAAPTAMQLAEHETPFSAFVVPVVPAAHVVPSLVVRATPPAPTAVQAVDEVHAMPFRAV